MLPTKLSSVSLKDFFDLVNNKVPESQQIEYKEILKVAPDKETKEFLYDVTSFANKEGGDIIYGITEIKGLPKELIGIEISDTDELKRKLYEIIRKSTKPQLVNCEIQTYHLSDDKYILLIRVPKGSLHQVTFQSVNKFYSRGVAGKYEIEYDELMRRAQNIESDVKTLSTYKLDALTKIKSGKFSVKLLENAKIALQFFPLKNILSNETININSPGIKGLTLLPLGADGFFSEYNYDGLIHNQKSREHAYEKSLSYLQIFRNGVIETVNSNLLRPFMNDSLIPNQQGWDYETSIVQCVARCVEFYRRFNIDIPIDVQLTFLNVEGYSLESNRLRWGLNPRRFIDRDILEFKFQIESYNSDTTQLLKPTFDTIWNIFGFEKSRNYNDDGKWIGPA